MKAKFQCELFYFPSLHLNQIYDGFIKLNKLGIIDLIIKPAKGGESKPLLKVVVNNEFTIIYDTLDGFNWIDGSIDENLRYFKKNIEADFYFKRSYNKSLLENAPGNCKVYPLGLNYTMKVQRGLPKGLKLTLTDWVRNSLLFSRFYRDSFVSKDFEYYPIPNKESKILFLTRLWNPKEVKLKHLREERKILNDNRIECIKACKKEFGVNFIGGLQNDEFSSRLAKELIMPFSITKKENFLKTIKDSNICIGTTGLHSSIGWKFGEYVAASRAIITEPLIYDLPGTFENKSNYFEYYNRDQLIENIYKLLDSKEKMYNMMQNNFHYYNNYLRPDYLVLNTLLTISQ